MAKVIYNAAAYENATRAKIIQNARTTWRRTYGDLADRILDDAIPRFVSARSDYPTQNPTFLDNLAVALDTYGKLTEKQTAAYAAALDKMEAKRKEFEAARQAKNATLKYVGTVGKRMEFQVTVKMVVEFQGKAFSYYDSGVRYMNIMEDADGNQIVYFGNVLGDKGDSLTLTATVKGHKEYKGAPQTLINRPKIQ